MLKQRLQELRDGGLEALAPLWLETLDPASALGELRSLKQTPLLQLQEASFLIALGQDAEADRLLESLSDLPCGLARLRDRLAAALKQQRDEGGAAEASSLLEQSQGLASKTLAELYASQGDRRAAISVYKQILQRDPSDAQARGRVVELEGGRAVGPEALLVEWLARVKQWRVALGV